jgi:hypothetical protein
MRTKGSLPAAYCLLPAFGVEVKSWTPNFGKVFADCF